MHDDAKSLVGKSDFSRREFVVTTLATGFALAVQPVSAATIETDDKGLIVGQVKIAAKDGQFPAYRAMPRDAGVHGMFPVVLVVEEIFGVHKHIQDLCRRLAKVGYMAIAPELFARQGDVSEIKDIPEIIRSVVSKVPDAQVMSDLDACVEYAKETGKGDTDKLAITGFCWGGRIVWLYAAHNPKLKAGVAWYGRVVGKPDDLHPKNPIDIAADITAPVLGLYGGKDTGITAADLDKMREALKAAMHKTEIHVYPEAQHGFNADYRPSYNKEAAEDGWKRMLEWFKKNLEG
jgi:carboxymethylenebutenolidase